MKNLKRISREYVDSLPKLNAPAGYIYVLQEMKFGDDFKIGKTKYPSRRLYEFGVQLPFQVKPVLVRKTDDASAAETYLHKRFERQSTVSEWFRLSKADLTTISELDFDSIARNERKRVARSTVERRKRRIVQDNGSGDDWTEESSGETDTYDDDWAASDTFDDNVNDEDIEDTIMSYDNLSFRDFSGVDMKGAELCERDLTYTNLWGADLSFATLAHSDLSGADLTETDLTNAEMHDAILMDCVLIGAILKQTNLSNSNFAGADMTAATLSGAILTNARFDLRTVLPNGTNWTPNTDLSLFTES